MSMRKPGMRYCDIVSNNYSIHYDYVSFGYIVGVKLKRRAKFLLFALPKDIYCEYMAAIANIM